MNEPYRVHGLTMGRATGVACDTRFMTVRKAIKASLQLLSPRDRRVLVVIILIQMATAFLDLLGVLLLGLVGALAVTTIQSAPSPPVVSAVSDTLGLSSLSGQSLVAALAIVAASILLFKSLISSLLTRRVFRFLANRQAIISERLAGQLLTQPLLYIQSRSSQSFAYALIQGTGLATVVLLGQLSVILTEVSVLVVLSIALFWTDPWVTAGAVLFFGAVAIVVQRYVGGWAARLGARSAEADIQSLNTLQDVLGSFREISVLNRAGFFTDQFRRLRWESASVNADRTYVLQVPKYIFEVALVVGAGILTAVLFATKTSVEAVGTLALFLAASTRVMPSLLRLQSASITIRDAASAATRTYELANDLDCATAKDSPPDSGGTVSVSGCPGHAHAQPLAVEIDSVRFRYPGSPEDTVIDVSASIPAGASVAIIGRSGAGKSTLADLLLGLLDPDSGKILIGGDPPAAIMRQFPGAVSYVPQDVSLIAGTVRANVTLGLDLHSPDDEKIWRALESAHVADVVRALPLQLDTLVGADGVQLSGGQRQRIGIARAILVEPSLLLLDEATSALDAETEAGINETLREFRGRITTVVIAHRLSTVRDADVVIYLEAGRVLGTGTFDELRSSLPSLATQADLMGLKP